MTSDIFQTGSNCWRIEQASRLAVIVDAADYFRVARDAMLQAREQIILVGWDVDPRILLDPDDGDSEAPNCLACADEHLNLFILINRFKIDPRAAR